MSRQTIYNALRAAGMTQAGALATMANLLEESGLEACRLEKDMDPRRVKSKNYAQAVDTGTKSVAQASGDSQGWGLAQWTYHTRKRALIELCKARGVSIADEATQVLYLLKELSEPQYKDLWKLLTSAEDCQLNTATTEFMEQFERPKIPDTANRIKLAEQLRKQLDLGGLSDDTTLSTVVVQTADVLEKYHLTTYSLKMNLLKQGDYGPQVKAMQKLLNGSGFDCGEVDGIFGSMTYAALIRFQDDAGLEIIDGECGGLTWNALLKE